VTGQWQKISIAGSTYSGPVGLVQSDLDGDGRQDLAVGFQDPAVGVAWYRSLSVDGTSWSTPYRLMKSLDGTPGTQAAGTTSQGLNNADVTVWAATTHDGHTPSFDKDYTSSYDIIGALGAGDFGNGQTDIVVSLIHVVVYSTSTSATDAQNNPSENTPMFFNRGIYVLWNNGGAMDWKMTPLYGTRDYFAAFQQGSTLLDANGNANPAATDIAVGDFNQDGLADIAAVYETGVTKIWLSQWSDVQGYADPFDATFNTTASLVIAANVPTVPGTAGPWALAGKVVRIRIADIDGNGYPDIIRTSAAPTTSGGNKVYVILTEPASPTATTKNPTFEYGGTGITAKVTGSKANLVSVDKLWENLTEVFLNSSVVREQPLAKVLDTTTGNQPLANLSLQDALQYQVAKTTKLGVVMTAADPAYSAMPVTQVTLRVKYNATSAGTTFLQWSKDNVKYYTTTIKPTTGTNVNVTYDLMAAGITTWAQLQNVYIRYYNNGTNSVMFDYIWLEVKFAVTRQLEWNWQVPNVVTETIHNLTINARVLTAGETFNVSYSLDNDTFFPLFQISSTTQTNYSASLIDTSNSMYYIKVVDTNRATTDTFNNTLCVNMVSIKHYSPTVYWPALNSNYQGWLSTLTSASEYISSIAVADMGKSYGDYKPDGKLDIVAGTTQIGNGDATHALFVITNSGSGLNVPINVPMVAASAAIGTNRYDVKAVEVGDFNGDGYMDIAVAIGFSPGYSYPAGSTSTLWIYMSQPSTSGMQFNEQPVNVLDTSGSVINIKTGYVDLTFLWPLFGVFGIVIAEAAIGRAERKRKE